MSVATEIQRLQTAKADIKTAIEDKGVTVPSTTKLDGYADLIEQISTGTIEAPENDVNFYDYDGFRVASYTIAEAKALTALPTPPTHDGLTFQEWNWRLSDIQNYQRKYIDIGANYATTDGKCHVHVTTDCGGKVVLKVFMSKNIKVSLDWGDGSELDSVPSTTSSAGTTRTVKHTYNDVGDYVVKLKRTSGSTVFYPSTADEVRSYVTEINYNDENNVILTTYSSVLISIPTTITSAKPNLGYSRIPTITIPRGVQWDFTTVSGLRNVIGHICFPPTIPYILAGNYLSSYKSTLVVPEFESGSLGANNLLVGSYVRKLSIPYSLKWSAAPSWSFNALKEIDLVQGWTPNVNISLSSSTVWTEESLVNFLTKLGSIESTITITLGSTNLAKLTEDEKAIATNKGYTLA